MQNIFLQQLSFTSIWVDFQALVQFVVNLCSSTINACEVNVARRILFAKGGRTVENIPPTLDALKQHIKWSAFQAF